MTPEINTILAIDPSTTRIGWCHHADCGSIVIPNKDRPARFATAQRELTLLTHGFYPSLILYYLPFARGADATRCGWGVAALIEARAATIGARVVGVSETTVRKFHGIETIFGKGHAREDLKRQAVAKARRLCFEIENDDEADACLLYDWGYNHRAELFPAPKKERKKK